MSEKKENKDLELVYLKETMKQFLVILDAKKNQYWLKDSYGEVLETEIKLVRNALTWPYNYKYFNVGYEKEEFWKRSSNDFKAIEKYCLKNEENDLIEIDLRNKNFFCDLWNPIRLFEHREKDSFIPAPYFLKNLEIGYVNGKGNHAMIKAIVGEDECKIKVHCLDDENFLKNVSLQNNNFYYEKELVEINDHKNASLILLTKLKLGYISLEELYKEIISLNVDTSCFNN